MIKMWIRKSHLWKFAAIYLAIFELIFFIVLVFFYNTIGWGLLTHLGDREGFLEYSEWYDNIYRPEHPNDEAIVHRAEMFQVFIFWGTLILYNSLVRQECKQRPAWKKGLLGTALYVVLLLGWFFILLPHLTHYRLFHVLMPTQCLAVLLLLQLAIHPDRQLE